MKPCGLVFSLLRLRLGRWEGYIRQAVANALRLRGRWPEAVQYYLRDARTWGRLLKASTAAYAEISMLSRHWLNARKQSALEVVA